MCGYVCMQCGACKGENVSSPQYVPCPACCALNDHDQTICKKCGLPLVDMTPGAVYKTGPEDKALKK